MCLKKVLMHTQNNSLTEFPGKHWMTSENVFLQ